MVAVTDILHRCTGEAKRRLQMTTWIALGAIAVPMLVLAIFLLNGKGAFLIAGYNTMSKEEKATYDTKALCKAVGKLLIILTALMMLFPLTQYVESMWFYWVVFILFMAITIGFAVYANTGNRYRINVDPNAPAGPAERKPMSRVKKVLIFIGILFSIQICIGVGIMIYQGERDPVVSVYEDAVRIRALYGLDVNFSNIDEITLIDKSMREIGIGRRTDGYSSGGQALKGNFNSDATGHQLLFVYSGSSPTIQITRTRGPDIFISFRDPATTEATYRTISTIYSAASN